MGVPFFIFLALLLCLQPPVQPWVGCWTQTSRSCSSLWDSAARVAALILLGLPRHHFERSFAAPIVIILKLWCSGCSFNDFYKHAVRQCIIFEYFPYSVYFIIITSWSYGFCSFWLLYNIPFCKYSTIYHAFILSMTALIVSMVWLLQRIFSWQLQPLMSSGRNLHGFLLGLHHELVETLKEARGQLCIFGTLPPSLLPPSFPSSFLLPSLFHSSLSPSFSLSSSLSFSLRPGYEDRISNWTWNSPLCLDGKSPGSLCLCLQHWSCRHVPQLLNFMQVLRDLNPGLHACETNIFSIEPSPQTSSVHTFYEIMPLFLLMWFYKLTPPLLV